MIFALPKQGRQQGARVLPAIHYCEEPSHVNIVSAPPMGIGQECNLGSMKIRTARSNASMLFSWGTSIRDLAIGRLPAS